MDGTNSGSQKLFTREHEVLDGSSSKRAKLPKAIKYKNSKELFVAITHEHRVLQDNTIYEATCRLDGTLYETRG